MLHDQLRCRQSVIRVALGTGLLLAILCLTTSTLHVAEASTAFLVDTPSDGHDSNLGDGVCNNGAGGCSLRAAIEQGFSVSSPVLITFDYVVANQTFTLAGSLGTIDWLGSNITVNGTTQNITVSGASLSAGQSIFRIQGNNNTLRNLTIRDAPQDGVQIGDFAGVGGAGSNNVLYNLTIIGNGGSGVYVSGQSGGGQNNTISGSGIGSSYASYPCLSSEANGYGVYIANGATGTKIGNGYSLNTIVCNVNDGVHIVGSGGSYNTEVNYNHIGTNGTAALSNSAVGIYNEAAGNTVIRNNIISGNGWAGVWVYDSASATIAGNYIGTDSGGTAAIPNEMDGIALTDGTTNSTVGSTVSADDRNVISGNTLCGIRIRDGAHDNTVDFNLIGLNWAGTLAIPNGQAGVAVFNNSNNNSIGTSMAGVSQYISGNTREGIYIENSSGNFIGQTSLIGVATDNTTARGNGLQGVMLYGATDTGVFSDLIAYNGGAGVAVVGNTATGNKFYVKENRNNGGLPIDLGNDGFTPNGLHTPPGPNNWLNYPVITGGSGSTISGTACANCTVYVHQAIGNPAAAGGGGIRLMEATADGSGNWNATLSAGLTRKDVSLVACQSPCFFSGNGSEMSPRPQLLLPLILR